MNRLITIAASAVMLAFASGCASTQQTSSETESAPKEQYSYVTETGSRIPKKVKKGNATDGSQNIEKGDSRTLETLQRDQTIRTMRRDGT